MKFDYVFIAVSIACGSTFALAQSFEPQSNLVARYAPDIEGFDARDFFDADLDAREFVDVLEERDDEDDLMELFERSVSPDQVLYLINQSLISAPFFFGSLLHPRPQLSQPLLLLHLNLLLLLDPRQLLAHPRQLRPRQPHPRQPVGIKSSQ